MYKSTTSIDDFLFSSCYARIALLKIDVEDEAIMKAFQKKSLLIIGLFLVSSSFALPARIIIVRHAEKPLDGKNLDKLGYERAAALPYYFQKFDGQNKIVAVYAMRPNSQQDSAKRPVETCQPTANYFKLPLNVRYSHDDYPKLVEEIKNNPAYQGKTVLICWEHRVIPKMANDFGIRRNINWPSDVFDATWIIQYNKSGKPEFHIESQHLLYGDSVDVTKNFN